MLVLTGALGVALALALYLQHLPNTDDLWRRDEPAKVAFLAMDGAPLLARGAQYGEPVRLADLPAHVPNAILAVEDRNFRHHFGFNPLSVIRAFLVNAREGVVRQGGSTITQQLAKNIYLSSEKTLSRKVQELLLAIWLESRFTKDEILTLYLNRVYFGAGAYGIDAASRRYFSKAAHRLSIGEAAVLAGLLKAPSRFAPTHNPGQAGERASLVLRAMVNAGFLTPDAARAALRAPVRLADGGRIKAPHFNDFAEARLHEILGHVDADLVVETTLQPAAQRVAEQALASVLRDVAPSIEAAVVILDETGAIRVMIGGRDYARSQFNRAAQAKRQPGSAFKPFVYLAAAERGASRHDRLTDAPVSVGDWSPDNYKSRFYGDVSMTEALALSLNAATVRLQETIGRGAVRTLTHRMGVERALTRGPAVALGVDAMSPLTLAGAFTPFANGGYRVRPYAIKKISTVDGQILHQSNGAFADIAAPGFAIDEVNAMMRAVTAWGTGKAARLDDYQTHGKTGTSQDNRDAWFVGHAGGYTCAVWVGRDDNKPMKTQDGRDITGGGVPARIWRAVMSDVLRVRDSARYGPKASAVAPLQPTFPNASLAFGAASTP